MKLATAFAACLIIANSHAEETGVLRNMQENKFAPMAGLPSCLTLAVQSGDPSKGASIILFKTTTGCVIPWHWHTPNENVMMVSGKAKVAMKDGGATAEIGPGGYAMMPSKHVHQFTCTSSCTAFLYSDAAFDIHYVDASGKEIPPEAALAKQK